MKKALLIGINYIDIPSCTLRGCIDDVVNIGNMLTSQYGYGINDVTILRDDTPDPGSLPTYDNIIQELQNIVAISPSCTQIWIHYSGHGALINNASQQDGAIVPSDFADTGYIMDNDLFAIIRNIKCPTMIMMDSCNSGSICDLEWNYEYLYGTKFMRTQLNRNPVNYPNIFIFSGSKINQYSADIFDVSANMYEGAFTDAVLNTLAASNYQITLGKLIQGVCTWIVNKGIENQTPVLSSSSPAPSWSIRPVNNTATNVIQENFKFIITP
jgi:hypothetical protein